MALPSYDPASLLLGVIGRPHGLRGEITLRAYNNRGADLSRVRTLILDRGQGPEERQVLSVRPSGDVWLFRLQGVDSRDAAAALTHAAVRVRRDALPPLGPGEFFVEDVLGSTVRTDTGQVLGVVGSVFWNGAHDVMVVSGDTEQLIPLVPTFVRSVDGPARQVIVAWDQHE